MSRMAGRGGRPSPLTGVGILHGWTGWTGWGVASPPGPPTGQSRTDSARCGAALAGHLSNIWRGGVDSRPVSEYGAGFRGNDGLRKGLHVERETADKDKGTACRAPTPPVFGLPRKRV